MKSTAKLALMFALFFTPVMATPSTATAAAQTFLGRTITSMATWSSDGHTVIELSGGATNTCGTNGTTSTQFSLGTSVTAGRAQMVQLATAAFLAGRRVNVVTYNTTSPTCNGNQEAIFYLQVLPN